VGSCEVIVRFWLRLGMNVALSLDGSSANDSVTRNKGLVKRETAKTSKAVRPWKSSGHYKDELLS